MTTLALDTSTAAPSLALVHDDGTTAALCLGASPHAGRRVLQAIHGLLAADGTPVGDLTRIVVGVGPGGFTGVRIGISTGLGLGQGLGCPVVGCVSLEALALTLARGREGDVIVPCLDARRAQVFTAAYRIGNADTLEVLMEPCALAPDVVARWAHDHDARIGGPGAGLVMAAADGALAMVGEPDTTPSAIDLVRRVEAGGERPARPVYARLPDAEVNRRAAQAAAL